MFRDDKATAAACYFLERAPKRRLNDLKLMKLLYLAERESLRRYTATITEDAFFSMQNGPVLSNVLSIMKGEGSDLWAGHIAFIPHGDAGVSENTVELKAPLPVEQHLSAAEIEILEAIWKQYKNHHKWDLVDLTHDFPEWHAAAKDRKTSIPLTVADIFRKGLKEPAEIAEAKAADLDYYRNLRL